jgi:RNA polymerase sigma-70 factor (sigma-E family)
MVEVAVDEAGVTNFEGYVVAAAGSLLKLAYLLTGNVADAEELLQETFARIFVAWPQVETADDPDAYVRQVLINANRRRFRRHRVTEVLDGHPREGLDRRQGFAAIEDRNQLASALAALPRRQRSVVVLRYYEGIPEREVASLLGCSPGTVKSQASKALAKLRAQLDLGQLLDTSADGGNRE